MTLTMFASHSVDLDTFGFHMPASSVWAFNGIFLLLLAPVVIWVWSALDKRGRNPSFATKFAFGILFAALGYMVLGLSVKWMNLAHKISMYWVAGSYALQEIGELCLSPIGLAMIAAMVPQRLRGMMMGVWFIGMAVGNNLAGHFAQMASLSQHHVSWQSAAKVYGHAFMTYGLVAFGIGVFLLMNVPLLRRLSEGKAEVINTSPLELEA